MRLPSPQRLGLPERFANWRLTQERAILALLEAEERFSGVNAPTGSGKTATAIGVAQLLPDDQRVLILTSTKALQSQVEREFYSMGLRDVRGKSNYVCVAASETNGSGESGDSLTNTVSVDHGPCFVLGTPCVLAQGGCTYFDATRAAREARIVSMSYAKWISTSDPDKEFGKFDWLIADEAGDAEQWLTDSLRVDLRRNEVESLLGVSWPSREAGVGNTTIADWREWARHNKGALDAAVRSCDALVKQAVASGRSASRELVGKSATLRNVAKAFTTLLTMRGDWVLDSLTVYSRPIGVVFDAVWPAPYAESMLWRGIERVVLMGATLVEKHMDILGVPRGDRSFAAYPSLFPIANRPIVFVKCSPPLKMSYTLEKDEAVRARASEIGDQLMRDRADRKGLVHTVSYARRDWLVARSGHRERLITHAKTSEATQAAVERFKAMSQDSGAVLVSPSISTGWDFPGTAAEWCWIPKLPFENRDSALIKARIAIDPKYLDFKMANTLTQMIGRLVRSASDMGEAIISDAQFGWHPWANRELYAKHVLDAIRVSEGVPRPPRRIGG